MRTLIALLLLIAAAGSAAHKPSDSYLSLQVTEAGIQGEWDIALRDLDFVLALDRDQDGAITWGEVRARHDDIAAYALARLELAADGAPCAVSAGRHMIDRHSDGAYAVLQFSAPCGTTAHTLSARYRLLFDVDPQHRGLLRLEHHGRSESAVFSPDAPMQRFALSESHALRQFMEYLRHGVWHIWIGFDHILFLLSLLLPAVMIRERGAWQPAEKLPSAFWAVAQVVTAFTLAHSFTLTLAALGVVALPSRLVESAIAASVVLAALNNIVPLVSGRRWLMAFVFGLIHGFGFASVLSDLGLPQGSLLLALVGFNLGVELGQLAIVAAFLPLAWWLRATWAYRRVVLTAGSSAVTLVALVWLTERAFDLRLSF